MRRQGGFTLIESLTAVALLAATVTAITAPFVAGSQNSVEDARQAMAVCLATGMMDEVLSHPFADPDGPSVPGPEAGEVARYGFDNIDDFHGLTEAAGELANPFGTVVTDPAADGLSRSVTVDYVYVAGETGDDPPAFVRVTVKVDHADRTMITLSDLVYAFAAPVGQECGLGDDDDGGDPTPTPTDREIVAEVRDAEPVEPVERVASPVMQR